MSPLEIIISSTVALMSLFTWLGSARTPGSQGRTKWLAGGITLAVGLFLESEFSNLHWEGIQPIGYAISLTGVALQWLGLVFFVHGNPKRAWAFFAGLLAVGIIPTFFLPGTLVGLTESLAFAMLFGMFTVPFARAMKRFLVPATGLLLVVYLLASVSFLFRGYLVLTSWDPALRIPQDWWLVFYQVNYSLASVAVLTGNISFLILMTAKQAGDLEVDVEKDPLTGAANRRALDRKLKGLGYRANEAPLSLVMVDIDHFKSVNDRYGHPVGDDVLKTLVQVLRNHLRRDDFLARFGGEEFCILMAGAPNGPSCRVIDRIREALAAVVVDTPKGPLSVTFSAGIATRISGGSETTAELLSRADGYLYQAKEGGRNRVVGEPEPGT